MPTDARSPSRNYPIPAAGNLVSEEFPRLITALLAIDTDIADLLTSVSQRALLSHTHTISNVTGLQAALDGKQSTTWRPALGDLLNVNVSGAANGQYLRLISGTWQPATMGGLDASAVASGVFDPARIPVLTGQAPVVSSGGLGALTAPQQAQIIVGTPVITTDGLRWIYAVSGGSKTDPASYIQLADITPEWSAIANKPTSFWPDAHAHAITDIAGLQTALDARLPLAGGTLTGFLSILKANPDIYLSKTASGQAAFIRGQNGSAARWQLTLGDETAETGGSTGSDFALQRVTDAGTFIDVIRGFRSDGSIVLGQHLVNGDGTGFEVNRQGAGDRVAQIDLHAHGTPGANDFSGRVRRNAGANGSLDVLNNGTGPIRLMPGANVLTEVGTAGSGNGLKVNRRGTAIGGTLFLDRPSTGSALAGDVAVDVLDNRARFYENGGSFRGFSVDLTACGAVDSTTLLHSANLGAQIASMAIDAVGMFGFFAYAPGGVLEGNIVAGSSMRWSDQSAHTSGNLTTGSWIAQGRTVAAGHVTLFRRVA